MHGRDQKHVYRQGNGSKVSAARIQQILSSIPRNQTDLIGGLGSDWRDIEEGLVTTITNTLQVTVRAFGHHAITSDVQRLLRHPDDYHGVAHERYIETIKLEHPRLLDALQVRQLFPLIDISDQDMHAIMRKAAERVKRTPDEPKLIVIHPQSDAAQREPVDIFVTFAT